jgi:hypothetical protein
MAALAAFIASSSLMEWASSREARTVIVFTEVHIKCDFTFAAVFVRSEPVNMAPGDEMPSSSVE